MIRPTRARATWTRNVCMKRRRRQGTRVAGPAMTTLRILWTEQAELDEGDEQREDQQDERHRRGLADVEVAERGVVDQLRECARGVARPARREQVRLHEQGQGARGGRDEDEEQ